MANVGSLVVDLRANSAAFVAEMEKARTATERLGRNVETGMSRVGTAFQSASRFIQGFAGALSVGAVIEFGRRAAEAAGGLGELAQQLGISAEALQVYRFSAVQTGATSEQLETALIKLNDTVGSAAAGNDQAIASFERLGVKILDAGGNVRSTEAILRDVARAIADVGEPARQIALLNDIAGRSAARLLPFLSDLAGGYDQMRDAATQAGVVLSTGIIESLDRSGDSWAVNQLRIQAWAATVANDVINAINAAVAGLDRLGINLNVVRDALAGMGQVEGLGRILGTADPIRDLNAQIFALERNLRNVQISLEAARRAARDSGNSRNDAARVRGLTERESQLTQQLDTLRRQLSNRNAADGRRLDERTDFTDLPDGPRTFTITGGAGARNPVGTQTGRASAAAIDRQAEAFDRLLRSIDPAYKAIREYEDARATLDAGLARGSLTVAEHGERVEQLNVQYNQAAKSALGVADGAARATDRTGELIQAFEGFGRSSAKTIADMVVGLDQANFSIGRLIQTLASGILEKLIYERITGPLTRAAGGFLDNLLGSAFGIFGGKSAAFAGVPAGVTAVAVGHGGGVGRELGRSRAADAMAFVGAPRFHAGKAPWGPGEMPAIIRPDETVLTPGQMRALGPRSDVVVNIIDQRGAGAAPVETRETSGPNGERMIDVFIADRVNRNADNGGLDRAMQRNFGIARAPARRS